MWGVDWLSRQGYKVSVIMATCERWSWVEGKTPYKPRQYVLIRTKWLDNQWLRPQEQTVIRSMTGGHCNGQRMEIAWAPHDFSFCGSCCRCVHCRRRHCQRPEPEVPVRGYRRHVIFQDRGAGVRPLDGRPEQGEPQL